MGQVFETTRRVEFCETDAAGIVHFSAYLCYMEQAEHAFLRSLGLSVMERQADGSLLSWPRVRVECDFFGPARFEELLKIEVSLARIGGKSVTYHFDFFSPEGVKIAQGHIVAACCVVGQHGSTMSSVEIPTRIRSLLSPYIR